MSFLRAVANILQSSLCLLLDVQRAAILPGFGGNSFDHHMDIDTHGDVEIRFGHFACRQRRRRVSLSSYASLPILIFYRGTFSTYSLLSRFANITKRDPREASLIKMERYLTTDLEGATQTIRSRLEKSRFARGLLKTIGVLAV